MVDGWEDVQRRSLYGTLAAEVGKPSTVLSLEDVTGQHGDAKKMGEVVGGGMVKMELVPRQHVGLVTDNPMVMKAFRRFWVSKYPWVQAYPCFLHGLNTMLGHIVNQAGTKKVVSRNAKIVSFFNNSHYWEGQLDALAVSLGITHSLKTNTESRWYALILQALSVQEYHNALVQLCLRPDAQRKTNGYTPVSADVLNTVIRDLDHWKHNSQLIRTCKPIVDAIGNLETRDCTLADCMLELLRCARDYVRLEILSTGDVPFAYHAKATFNTEFHKMDTELQFFALFLHPLCRSLAISQVAKSRSLKDACQIGGAIAQKWGWTTTTTRKLLDDLKAYFAGKSLFTGGSKNAREWWEQRAVTFEEHPLKSMTVTIFSLVPHSAEVERLFSNLGGIQSVRRSNLTVANFERLGKLRSHYTAILIQEGLLTKCQHAHMHTRPGGGVLTLTSHKNSSRVWCFL
ncbi:hypothetical protein K439DRAFT_1415198 [Ramaria rubella]|nr:hypothetical protein K439DRAFT_1415198 [Ramaria rubella]